MGTLVTIKTFTYSHEAVIIRSRLEADGIRCFVQDELTTQIHPFMSSAIGGVKLQVRDEDAEEAIAMLKESGDLTDSDFDPSSSQLRLYRFLSKTPFLRRFFREN